MRIVLPPDDQRRASTLEVDPARRPTRARPTGKEHDVFLDWDQALDDQGHLRRCLLCRSDIYRRKAFPQITGFVVLLAFALALVALLGFADNILLLIGMLIVLFVDVCILLFASTHLVCYGCRASFRSTDIAPWHKPWNRDDASRYATTE